MLYRKIGEKIASFLVKNSNIEEMEADHIKPYSQGGPTKL